MIITLVAFVPSEREDESQTYYKIRIQNFQPRLSLIQDSVCTESNGKQASEACEVEARSQGPSPLAGGLLGRREQQRRRRPQKNLNFDRVQKLLFASYVVIRVSDINRNRRSVGVVSSPTDSERGKASLIRRL